MTDRGGRVTQCQKPTGWLGQLMLRNMNSRHSKLTDWGLSQIAVEKHYAVLDLGCGGGRTVSELASLVTQGRVCGVDYSRDSVAVATRTNKQWIDMGRVEILESLVSQLPFAADTFDLVTAVETHFWWPDLAGDMREVLRVLRPAGKLMVVAEIYKAANTMSAKLAEKYHPPGMTLLSVSEHRELFAGAGYTDIQVIEERKKGWICGIGVKPAVGAL